MADVPIESNYNDRSITWTPSGLLPFRETFGSRKSCIGFVTAEGAKTLRAEFDKFTGDRPAPAPVKLSGNVEMSDEYLVDVQDAINRSMRRLAAVTATPWTLVKPAPQFRRGAKVHMNITAYISKVNTDGTFELASTREPFADPIQLDRVHISYLTEVTPGPEPIKVGDTITAKQVRETPWKRGTVLRGTKIPDVLLLTAAGQWRSDDGAYSEFEDIQGVIGDYVVIHAPGKDA